MGAGARVATLGLALIAPACGERGPQAERRRAEAEIVRLQIDGLKKLVDAATRGELSTSSQIAIGIDEDIVRDIVSGSLPVEKDIGKRFHIRLDSAEVRFRNSQSLVLLGGRASLRDHRDPSVTVLLAGGLGDLRVDEHSGTLKAGIVLHYFEVEKLEAGGDRPVLRRLVQGLGRESLSAIQEVIPEIEIPVRLDPAIKVKGLEEGPITVGPGELPLHFAVARVVPLRERLWVLIDATVGEWKKAPELGVGPPEGDDGGKPTQATVGATP